MNNKKIIGLLLSASMVMTAVAPAFAAVTTDKTTAYNYGDSITINRENTEDAKFIIKNPAGAVVLNDAMTGGKKSFTFKIPADSSLGWTTGEYTVTIGNEEGKFTLEDKPTYEGQFVKWESNSATIVEGRQTTIYATFSDVPDGAKIVYESNDTSVATVTGNKVYGVRRGTAGIKATLKDADGNVLATSTKDMTINVLSDDGGSGGGGSVNVGGSSGTGGSGTIAGGNVGGSTGSIGIVARPDTYTVNFQDLDQAAWATEAITSLAKKGIISGYDEYTFAPNASITRAEFAKLVSSLYGLVSSSSQFASQTFSDVSKDAWYFNYVEVCAQLGIITGYEDGEFKPNNLISRQEMAVIIYRTTKVMNTTLTPVVAAKTFDDSDQIADYAKEAVSALQVAGIISGTSDTTFEPTAGSTRAQAATIMYNMYTKYAK